MDVGPASVAEVTVKQDSFTSEKRQQYYASVQRPRYSYLSPARRPYCRSHLQSPALKNVRYTAFAAANSAARVAAEGQLEAARSRLAHLKDIERSKYALISHYASLVP
jgi:hypothetical protein